MHETIESSVKPTRMARLHAHRTPARTLVAVYREYILTFPDALKKLTRCQAELFKNASDYTL
jgi:hypothetical protein